MESRGCPKRNGMPSLGVYSTSGPNWCDLYFSVIIFPSIVNRHCAGKCAPFTDREADTGAEVQQCVVICRAQEHDGIVKNCYATVHCHLSEYELYIYGNSPVRQCNGVMCWGSFSSKFFSWEWEKYFKKLGLKGQDNPTQEVFRSRVSSSILFFSWDSSLLSATSERCIKVAITQGRNTSLHVLPLELKSDSTHVLQGKKVVCIYIKLLNVCSIRIRNSCIVASPTTVL